jgi:flagellar basal-body rod protein FlgF
MKAIWVPVSAQVAQQQRVDTLANNIANANTVGFKQEDTPFREYVKELEHPSHDLDIPRKDFSIDDMYRSPGAHQSYVKTAGSYTDFTQGQIKPTTSDLDLAIEGQGFLKVRTPIGDRYTRSGSLALNSQQQLVTAGQGYPLLNERDEPITFPKELSSSHQWLINQEGMIQELSGKKVAQLKVVTTEQLQDMRKEGQHLYALKVGAQELPSTARIHQRALEESNINVIKQMSELISSQRNVEQLQRAISTYDSINNRAMNDLMK